MVEGGILAPIFAMMMMLTVYLGGVYQTKYRSFVKERFYTWYYASSGCTASIANSNPDGDATAPQNPPSDPCNQAQDTNGASSSLGVAHAYDQEQWTYGPTLRFNNGNVKTVRTDGYVVCNEKKVAPGIGGIFSQLGNELKQMFGQVSGGNSPCN